MHWKTPSPPKPHTIEEWRWVSPPPCRAPPPPRPSCRVRTRNCASSRAWGGAWPSGWRLTGNTRWRWGRSSCRRGEGRPWPRGRQWWVKWNSSRFMHFVQSPIFSIVLWPVHRYTLLCSFYSVTKYSKFYVFVIISNNLLRTIFKKLYSPNYRPLTR